MRAPTQSLNTKLNTSSTYQSVTNNSGLWLSGLEITALEIPTDSKLMYFTGNYTGLTGFWDIFYNYTITVKVYYRSTTSSSWVHITTGQLGVEERSWNNSSYFDGNGRLTYQFNTASRTSGPDNFRLVITIA